MGDFSLRGGGFKPRRYLVDRNKSDSFKALMRSLRTVSRIFLGLQGSGTGGWGEFFLICVR